MLSPSANHKIYLASEPVDMRGGFERLSAKVAQAGLRVQAGHLFVFLSRRRTHLKILTSDGSGLVIFYKRISKGTFEHLKAKDGEGTILLEPAALATLLSGLRSVRHNPLENPVSTGSTDHSGEREAPLP